jgi:hypothetical protein
MAIILTSYSLYFSNYSLNYLIYMLLSLSREAILALALIWGIIFPSDEVIKVVTPGP